MDQYEWVGGGASRTLDACCRPTERPSPGRIASHLAVMFAVAAVMGVVVAGLAIPFAGVGPLRPRRREDVDNLPAELKTEELPQKTRIVDSSGNVIATLYDENRIIVR